MESHRLGYEPKGSMLSPVDSVTHPRFQPRTSGENTRILHASCTYQPYKLLENCSRAPLRPAEGTARSWALGRSRPALSGLDTKQNRALQLADLQLVLRSLEVTGQFLHSEP